MPLERLDKILASQNVGSRKQVGERIRHGEVAVNGTVIKRPEQKVDAEKDRISVNGNPVYFRRFLYLMMNKPAGVLSASRDAHARTVLDLLPPEWKRRGLFPAGRLDRDTTGLLIITDDGDYAHRILAPKSHVWKRYHALLDRPIEPEDIERFRKGVVLPEFTCLPAELAVLSRNEAENRGCLAEVKIREGKFHQVKKMFAACGKTVLQLKRVAVGGLSLDSNLEEGEIRVLSETERNAVFLQGNLY